jgi:hypothetical protein
VAHEKRGARLRPARPTGTRPAGRRLAYAIALALATALAVAGCASAPADTTIATGVDTGGGPALTQATALQAFDAYVATSAKAAATDDGKLALSVVTGVQQSLVSATLKSHSDVVPGTSTSTSTGQGVSGSGSFSFQPSLSQYSYSTPTLYLPEPSDYPRFFVADATRTLVATGVSPETGATTSVGGAQVPVDGRVLMVFEQSAAAGPWELASVSQFPAGTTLPPLATDKSGYVPQVPLMSTGLLAQPYATGPLQAAVVDDGPAGAAAKAVAAGPLTTGLYQKARDGADIGLKAPTGDAYQWSMEGTPYPAFALRTADGGALVLYAMYLNSTVAVPGYFDDASPVQPGAPIKVPLDLLPLLPSGQPSPRVKLEAQSLFSFAATDPAATSSKITVLAIGGGLNYATAS